MGPRARGPKGSNMVSTTYTPDMGPRLRIKTKAQVESIIETETGEIIAKLVPINIETERGKMTILHMELFKALEPSDLKYISQAVNDLKPFIKGDIVVLSARAPIWWYVYTAHIFHGIVRAVAVFDPKLKGAVVVMSHTRNFEEGEIVKLPEDIVVQLTNPKTPQ